MPTDLSIGVAPSLYPWLIVGACWVGHIQILTFLRNPRKDFLEHLGNLCPMVPLLLYPAAFSPDPVRTAHRLFLGSFLAGCPLRYSPDKRLCDDLTKESSFILPYLKWMSPSLSCHFSLAQVSSGQGGKANLYPYQSSTQEPRCQITFQAALLKCSCEESPFCQHGGIGG